MSQINVSYKNQFDPMIGVAVTTEFQLETEISRVTLCLAPAQRLSRILVEELTISAKRICGVSVVNLAGRLSLQKNVCNPTHVSPYPSADTSQLFLLPIEPNINRGLINCPRVTRDDAVELEEFEHD